VHIFSVDRGDHVALRHATLHDFTRAMIVCSRLRCVVYFIGGRIDS